MNEIQRLIHEMCPDGVPMVALGETISNLRTGLNPRIHFKLNTPDARGYYITVRELKGFTIEPDEKTDRINEQARLRINERSKLQKDDILFSGTGTIGRTALLNEEPANWNIKEGVYAITPQKDIISPRFLLYILHSNSIKEQIEGKAAGAAVRSVPMSDFKNFQIPLPPLPIQQRIVEILDKFTSLVSSLDSEIALRQKQYEYYRNKLLSFEEGDEEYIKLGKICQIRNGYTPSKTNLEYWTNGTIPWFRLEDIRQNGRILSDAIQHITELAVKKGGPFKANSVIVSTTATIGEHAIITVPFVCNQQITILTPLEDSILPKYLYYCGYLIGEWCKNNVNGAGLAIIPSNKLTECEIPVPSLVKQLSIVRTLDTFESLLTNLKKERELRQKQYEYYREKLLTFA